MLAGCLLAGLVAGTAEARPTLRDSGSKGQQAEQDTERDRSRATQVSRAFLDTNRVNPETVRLSRVWVDGRGTGHTRWRQMQDGLPVWGAEGILHVRGTKVYDVTNGFVAGMNANTSPGIDAASARAIALSAAGCPNCTTEVASSDLWVARMAGADRLVYRVVVVVQGRTQAPEQLVLFVDAHTAEIVEQYDNLHTGTGLSLYRGNLTIPTLNVGGSRFMEDTTRRVGTFDFRNGTASAARATDADDIWNAANQRAAVDAHSASIAVMDYLRLVHARTGIDGRGGPGVVASANNVATLQVSGVHYGVNYNNAFWDGQKIILGDGDGTTFGPLVALDIIAHEWIHGLTQYTANLTYNGESGALNESFSDVFGAMVERQVNGETANTWKIGEDAFTPAGPGDALRYLNNPRQGANLGYTANDQPDHYLDRYTGTQDNGGVHVNSGIANYAFYLTAKGGTHRRGGSATGIGADAAARIWYRALTTYMTSSSNFSVARTATMNAARDLFGLQSTSQIAVQRAWCLVGVGQCPVTELLTNGGFETTVSPWVSTGAGAVFRAAGGSPRTGTGNFNFGGANSQTGRVYQEMLIAPNAVPSLSFNLAVVSSDTGTTAKDRLVVEVQNSAGTVLATLATFSNTNRTAAGTYVLRGTYPMTAYAGQRVRIAFRVSTDALLPTTFRLDDVSLK